MLRDKMLAVIADLNREVVEREELIEAIAIALLTRKNLFILGEPGQAKSFVVNGFRSRITGARQFERLLTKQADEEQLFGRVDLSSLIPGQVPQAVLDHDGVYQRLLDEVRKAKMRSPPTRGGRKAITVPATPLPLPSGIRGILALLHSSEPTVQTTGKIPEAEIVFLDECFKANDGGAQLPAHGPQRAQIHQRGGAPTPSPPSPSSRRPTRSPTSATPRRRSWLRSMIGWN